MRTELETCGSIDSLPEFCTPADLSLILPVSRATLYRIPREPFKRWIEQECVTAGSPSMGVM